MVKNNYLFNHTTRVEAVIDNLETVLKKSRNSLLDDEVQLLEESLDDLRKLKGRTFTSDDFISFIKVVTQLLRFFDIDIS
jgi:hypothetical protein